MDQVKILKTPRRFRPALAFAIWLAPLALQAADWPQFLGPDRNGISAETNLAGAWPAEGPPLRWKKDIGQGFSGPVVARGKLILFHRKADQEIIDRSEEHTSELQSLRHLVCRL